MPSRYVSAEDPMFDFQAIELTAGKSVFAAVKEVKYSGELSRKLVYGTGRKPIGKTGGQAKFTASAVFYRSEFERFVKDELGGSGFALKSFSVTVQWSVPGADIVTDSLIGCSLTKLETGGSSGDDPTEVSFDLMPMNILFNGNDLVDTEVLAAA